MIAGMAMLAHGDIINHIVGGCLSYVFLITAWIAGLTGLAAILSSTKTSWKPARVAAFLAIALAAGTVVIRVTCGLSQRGLFNEIFDLDRAEDLLGEELTALLFTVLPAGIPCLLGGLTLLIYRKKELPRS